LQYQHRRQFFFGGIGALLGEGDVFANLC